MKQRPEKRFLYFIQHGDTSYYKIGIATQISARLSGLQTGNPFKLTVIRAFEFTQETSIVAESRLHKKFETHSVQGEWFSFTEQNLQVALAHAEEMEKGDPALLKVTRKQLKSLLAEKMWAQRKVKFNKPGRYDPSNWKPGDPMGVSPPPFKKMYWHDGYIMYLKKRGLPIPSEDLP